MKSKKGSRLRLTPRQKELAGRLWSRVRLHARPDLPYLTALHKAVVSGKFLEASDRLREGRWLLKGSHFLQAAQIYGGLIRRGLRNLLS